MINLNFIFKRVFDILISLFLIITLSPFLLLISLSILLEIKENPIFIQLRNGKNLKKFKIFKFKTMYKSEDGIKNFTQVKKFDTRVTIIGNFLRKNSIDELPQIFNVLLGNMSLVGPRPHPIALDKKFEKLIENYNDRYNVLPGITGLLQINERNTSEFSTWYKYDIEYIENWSLYLDLKIIFKTPLSIIKGRAKGL